MPSQMGVDGINVAQMNGGNETMSGCVCLHKPLGNKSVAKIRLVAKVYESTYGHYMVLYQDKQYCNASTFINLKNCSVLVPDNNNNTITILPPNCDGVGLTFEPRTGNQERWVDALRAKDCNYNVKPFASCGRSLSAPRSPVMMPVLEESTEEV